MSENYFSLKEKLISFQKSSNNTNFRDNKNLLIQLRKELHTADLSYDQKKEINALFDDCFEKVNSLFEKEKEDFERESEQNHQKLAPKINEALIQAKYAEEDDLNDAWNFCISVQQEFKGIKLVKEVRENLYAQLQEAFDMIKEKKDNKFKAQAKESIIIKENLMPEIEKVIKQVETTTDISALWQTLMEYQQKVREANLSYEVRNQMLNKLQEGFTILKIRREEEKQAFESDAKDNLGILKELVAEGEELAQNSDSFKEAFERLKEIQQAFRDYKLLAEDREDLYQRLQNAFEVIKQRQNDFFNLRNKEAIDNYNRIKPLVEAAFERAQNSMEFKKTREHLKRVQAEFKGVKMNGEERQVLYAKLQAAFDLIGKRQDEYYAAKKDKIELHVNYQLSDIILRIEAIQNDINKDLASIQNLSESDSNPIIDEMSDPSQDINNHIQILKASIVRKEEELAEMLEMKENLIKKKDKWEGIE
jgi:hypothetical protein